MDWPRLISTRRLGRAPAPDSAQQPRTEFTRDYDRIIFSSAFRRLQDKTQVFPLARNDYVRTRLTHSLEVASVGRSLGMLAADVILRREPELSARVSAHDIGTIVATACLAHDIGNPPFGHSGEAAIQEWFAAHDMCGQMTAAERIDLLKFEGNAQGLRTLCTLHNAPQRGGMQLTAAVLGAFTKYPRASLVDSAQQTGVSGKKFGFMQSEAALFEELADALGLVRKPGAAPAWHRHPLAFLVEAADDICYHVIDAEDGFKTGCLSFEELCTLHRPWLNAAQWARGEGIADRARRVEYFRAVTVDAMVQAMVRAFDDHYDALMNGSFDDELASRIDLHRELKAFTEVESRKIYTSRPVVEVLACGFEVIGGLLDSFVDAIEVAAGQRAGGPLKSRTLLGLMPEPQVEAGKLAAYQRALLATDYVVGMTDSFALGLYRRIRGIALP